MYILTKFLNYLNIYTINNNVFNNAVNDIFNNNNDHHINHLESGTESLRKLRSCELNG